MQEKLKELALRYEDLQAQLADPSVYGDAERLKTVNRELKDLTPVAEAYQAYRQAEADRAAAEELLSDPEMRELAQEELTAAREEMERLRQELKLLLLPKDPNDRKNVILEIRAGTGGEEAALFAASLLRMYTMYAAARGWRTDTVELNETELGGVKECSVLIEGEGAWSRLKFESGVQPGPAGAGDGVQWPHPDLRRHGGRAAGGGRGGREAGPCGHRDAGLPGQRRGWPACEQDVLRRAADPPAHRPGSGMPAGAQPVPEPGQGHAPSGVKIV